MPFFGKGNNDNKGEPKGRSLLGILFNPEIGRSLRPLGENATAFTYLIAMVFASNGLFPKNHPALTGVEGARLNLTEIFTTAWNDLSFTKEGLPKVILFFAVTGAMVFSALAVVTLLLVMALGHAHAQTSSSTSYFTPPDTTNDLAQGWLNFLFNNQPLPTSIDTNGTIFTQYTGVQTALISALAFYSNAILILAAVVLFYHLISMVVETAHHGVAMGKRANQIWAPIRLVFAIGLLVPVGANGLNSGQYIVIQMAQWGSGLASQVWNIYTSKSFAYVPPPTPYTNGLAQNIVAIAACVEAMSAINTSLSTVGITQSITTVTQQTLTASPSNGLATGETGYSYDAGTNGSTQDVGICGKVIFPAPPQFSGQNSNLSSLSSTVTSAYKSAYDAAYSSADTAVKQYFTASPPNFLFGGENPSTWTDIVGQTATQFQTTLSSSLTSALSSLGQSSGNTGATAQNGWGWIAAGAYFNQVAYTQSGIEQVVTEGMPRISPPALISVQNSDASKSKQLGSPYKEATEAVNALLQWTGSPLSGSSTPLPTAATNTNQTTLTTNCDPNTLQAIQSNFQAFVKSVADEYYASAHHENVHIIDVLGRFADYTAAMNCVWQPAAGAGVNGSTVANTSTNPSGITLGFMLTDADPFAEMARLGHANLNTAYGLLDQIMVVDVGAGVAGGVGAYASAASAGKGLAALFGGALVLGSGAAQIAGGILGFLGLIFFACGFTLAYFLPLIPFIKFFFNAVSWVATVLEGVVMVPLIALAHINPEGDGLPGASAKSAYFFILNIFLRPVLMIFGLVCGLLVFMTAVAFLNTLYMTAIGGALGDSEIGRSHMIISRLIFSIMYVVLLYIAANNSFKLIHAFGDNALLWIGQNPHRRESFGEADDLGRLMPAVSGYAGQQVFSQAQQAGQKIAQGAQRGLNAMGQTRAAGEKEASSSAIAATRHQQLLAASGGKLSDRAEAGAKAEEAAAAAADAAAAKAKPP